MNYSVRILPRLSRVGLFYVCGFILATVSPAPTLADIGDAAFISAREAVRTGDRQRLAHQMSALKDHPLRLLAEYWNLRMKLEDRETSEIPQFLAANAGSYLADKLRGDWLRALGKQGDWARFQRELPGLAQMDAEITCYAAQANKTPEIVKAYWLSGQDLPKSCETLVDQWVATGGLKVEDVWQRIRRVLEAKRVLEARNAAAYLLSSEGFSGHPLESIAQAPTRYLDKLPANFAYTRGGREVALFAIQRLARSEPSDAARRMNQIEAMAAKATSNFSAEELAYGWGQIAWQAATRHQPEALGWYDKAGATQLSEDALAWKVRAALRVRDWPTVLRTISSMPPALASQPDWIYWQARALAAQDRRREARALYSKISGQANFYGNLADDELGYPIDVPPKASAPTEDEIAAAGANEGLKRAIALFRLDMRVEGVREWAWAVRDMSDRQLLAAADLAKRNELWDRAINTAGLTKTQHDFSTRYLAPFRDYVEPKASALALDNGWVYGLMRQESRFIMNAKSVVGAQGLMQVMPATAKWVAKKIKLTNYHPSQAADMETNVTLGTNYLKMVLDSLDKHPVLASAAYNAGPGRARRWRAEVPLEGAIYAETIPFAETRDYVKKVMSNSVYYSALFESRPQSLKTRLGTIRPRGSGETNVEDLP